MHLFTSLRKVAIDSLVVLVGAVQLRFNVLMGQNDFLIDSCRV